MNMTTMNSFYLYSIYNSISNNRQN